MGADAWGRERSKGAQVISDFIDIGDRVAVRVACPGCLRTAHRAPALGRLHHTATARDPRAPRTRTFSRMGNDAPHGHSPNDSPTLPES